MTLRDASDLKILNININIQNGGTHAQSYKTFNANNCVVSKLIFTMCLAFANSADPDQTPQNAASDPCLQCLSFIQQYFGHLKRYRNGLFQILGQVW